MYPIWAFLLGSGLRIGELVWLRQPNVDLKRRQVHVVEFVTALGYDLVASSGKSCDAVRTIERVRVLRAQRKLQSEERLAAADFADSDYVFRTHGQMSGLETKTDAIYFTVTIVATVGFGDITATGQAARALGCVSR